MLTRTMTLRRQTRGGWSSCTLVDGRRWMPVSGVRMEAVLREVLRRMSEAVMQGKTGGEGAGETAERTARAEACVWRRRLVGVQEGMEAR